MLKKIGIAVAALVAALALVIATRPSTYRVTRSTTVSAPPAIAYAQVADFHRWEAWSPWAHLDPTMQTNYAGADGAVGASYGWKGNDQVGEGRMTIVDVRPAETVGIRLEFLKPWQATSSTRFEFASAATGTQITWTMDGENNFVAKAFSLFTDMDKMIGSDFERGLGSLKKVAEAETANARVVLPAVAK
jgi:Polyketide cyclase / dehydrase and lipid transport